MPLKHTEKDSSDCKVVSFIFVYMRMRKRMREMKTEMMRRLQEFWEEEFEGEEGEVRLCEELGWQLWSSAMNL